MISKPEQSFHLTRHSQSYIPSAKQSSGDSREHGNLSIPQPSGRSAEGRGMGPVPALAHIDTHLCSDQAERKARETTQIGPIRATSIPGGGNNNRPSEN